MAYKFQKGTANLSGSIKLDSGYDLLAAGSNDLGTSAANFAVGYVSVLSASTVVSGAFFEGNASRMTGIAATDVTTTGTSTNSDFYPLFVDTAAGESGETVRVHSTVAINPGTGKLSATSVSASTGTGSFGGGISAGNAGFTVGYTGAVTSTAAITAGTSFIIGSADLNEADMEKLDGITNGTAAASKAVVLDASKDVAGLNDVSAAGLTLSDLDEGGILFAGSSGALNTSVDNLQWAEDREDNDGYLSLFVSSSASGSGQLGDGMFMLTDAEDDDICYINYEGAEFAVNLEVDGTVSGSGVLSVGAGATLAGALNLQAGGITNAGSIAGATTIDASGDLTVGSITMSEFTVDSSGNTDLDGTLNAEGAATFQSTISGSGALSVGAGATLAGALNMQSGGITNAGSIAGATTIVASSTISGSGALSVGAGATLAGALNMQNGGITNVGDLYGTLSVQGVTGSGLILDASMCASAASYLSLKDNLAEAFYVAQGGDTYLTFITTNDDESVKSSMDFIIGDNVNSGKFLILNGGIDFSGQKTLTASVNLDEDGESGIYHYQSHYIVSGSSAVVVDLPSLDNGYSMWFKRHPSMTNNVTIRPSGSTNLIDGINDPVVLETAGASMQLVGSGSLNWYIY